MNRSRKLILNLSLIFLFLIQKEYLRFFYYFLQKVKQRYFLLTYPIDLMFA